MKKFDLVFFLLLLFSFAPLGASSQGMPIFDAHVHYNQADWSVYSPEKIFRLFDQAGVRQAIVSSTPDEGTLRLFEYDPKRVLPVVRPYRTPADMGSWFRDPAILIDVEKPLEKKIYHGIGEFHLPTGQAKSDVVRGSIRLAAQYGIFLYAHTDEKEIEELLKMEPKVRILWAHAGMSAAPQTIRRLLGQYPALFVETSIRTDYAPAGKLDVRWKDLFIGNSDRSLIGSDTYITSRWESFIGIHQEIHSWLSQLPRETAEKIASKNAMRLTGNP